MDCREERANKRGRCDECSKTREREHSAERRAESHKSFYDTKRWRLTARHKKGLNAICEHCDRALSAEVHHDPPLHVLLKTKRNPYAMDVLVALCSSCHSRETMREQRGG